MASTANRLKLYTPSKLVEIIKQQREGSTSNLLHKACGRFLFIWRHPLVRLFPPLYILVTDLFVAAADPVDHSEIEFQLAFAGPSYNLMMGARFQPFISWEVKVFKWFLTFLALYLALRLPYLARQSERGRNSFWCNGALGGILPAILFAFNLTMFSTIWNNYLLYSGVPTPDNEPDNFFAGVQKYYGQSETMYLTNGLGMSWRQAGFSIASWVFFLDVFAVFSVSDLILQDTSQYPDSTRFLFRGEEYDLRKLYVNSLGGVLRRFVTPVFFLSCLIGGWLFIWLVARDLQVDSGNHPGAPLKELSKLYERATEGYQFSRSCVYGSQFLFDSLTVMQDWEFPTFENQMQVALFGTNIALEGRFFNYFAMVMMMMIDARACYNSGRFPPQEIGQFLDRDDHVWAITNYTFLSSYFPADLEARSTWESRKQFGCFNLSPLSPKELYEENYIKGGQNRFCQEMEVAAKNDKGWEYSKSLDAWYVDGVNACCDVRTIPLFDANPNYLYEAPEIRSIPIPIWRIFFILLPFTISACLAAVLVYTIPRSRVELTRRAVISYSIAQKSSSAKATHQKELKKGNRLLGEGRDWAVDRFQAVQNLFELDTRRGNEDASDSSDSSAEAGDGRDAEADQPEVYPIMLKKPAYKDAPLLLVCAKGVFSIQCSIDATISDLLKHLDKYGLHAGIPTSNIRLRSNKNPWKRIEDDVLVASITPKTDSHFGIVYMHASLNFEKNKIAGDKGYTIAKNVVRGCYLGLREIRISTWIFITNRGYGRRAEWDGKLRVPIALTLVVHGGTLPIEIEKFEEDHVDDGLASQPMDVEGSVGGVQFGESCQKPDTDAVLSFLDKDGDGELTIAELRAQLDTDGDGVVTEAELRAVLNTGKSRKPADS